MLTGAMIGGQLLLVIVSPLLTRLYTPIEFGFYGVFFFLLTTFGTTAAFRYDQALLATEDDTAALEVLALAGVCATLLGLLTQVLLSFLAADLAAVTRLPVSLWYWLPVGLTMSGFYWSLTGYAVCRQRSRDQALARLTYPATQTVIQLTLAGLGAGAAGLAAGQVLGLAFACTVLWLRLPVAERDTLLKVGPRRLLAHGRRYCQFPLVSVPATLLNTGVRWAPTPLLSLLYGAEMAGLFYLAQRVLAVPMNFIGIAVGQTYLGEARRLRQEGRVEALPHLFFRITTLLIVPALTIMVLIILFGRPLFTLVFGSDWTEAGKFAQLLAPLLAVRFVVTPISATFSLFERQSLQLPWEIANLVALGLSFTMGPLLSLPIDKVVLLYSLITIVSYVGRYLAIRRLLSRLVFGERL